MYHSEATGFVRIGYCSELAGYIALGSFANSTMEVVLNNSNSFFVFLEHSFLPFDFGDYIDCFKQDLSVGDLCLFSSGC